MGEILEVVAENIESATTETITVVEAVEPEVVADYGVCISDTFELAESLVKKLTWLNKLIESNPVVPILENLMFDKGVIYSSNLVATAFHTTHIKGTFLVPAKKFLKILKIINKKDKISFAIVGNKLSILINDESAYVITTETPMDFPMMPDVKKRTLATLDGVVNFENLNKVLEFTSEDQLRPAMTGIFFSDQICGTDGHRLMYKSPVGLTKLEGKCEFIIPGFVIPMLQNFEAVTIKANGEPGDAISAIGMKDSSRGIVFRVIDEKFPDYKNVIPESNQVFAKLDRKELIMKIKMALECANRCTHQIRLSFTKGLLDMKISSCDLDFGEEYNGKVKCANHWHEPKKVIEVVDIDDKPTDVTSYIAVPEDGSVFEIGVNGKFLLDSISKIDSKEITIAMSTPNKAIIINDEVLVMPVMLSNYSDEYLNSSTNK